VKNTRGELVGERTEAQMHNDIEFKKLALELIEDSGENWSIHSMAVMKRNAISRILYLNELYERILNVPGVICEFGVHWGASFATLLNLRNIHEPYNVERYMYGFDTFEGFPEVSHQDGAAEVGDYASIHGHEKQLREILSYHESISAFQDRKMFELIKGDAVHSVDVWLNENPGASIALAHFDMDLYAPTKSVLEKILPRFTRNSILVFDEFSQQKFPGEVMALQEVIDLMDVNVTRSKYQAHCAIVTFN